MHYLKKIFLTFVVGFFVVNHDTVRCGMPMGMPGGSDTSGFPMISEDQLKELEELNKMIEETVATQLSPEEQAQFYKDVDELTKMFENMSPEEFEQFMGDLFTEQVPPPPSAPPVQIQQKKEEIVIPVLTGEQQQKIATLLVVIDDIVKQIHTFLLQVVSYPDLSKRIENWAKKNRIANWPTNMDWDQFKLAIEIFVNKLIIAKEQDPVTKVYKYLLLLIEDESLFNNLAQLQVALNQEVPQIEVPELGVGVLSVETKKAIQNTCEKIAESLYVVTIPNALDELFAKLEPEATTLRESEEAMRIRALEEAGRPLPSGYVVRAGVEPVDRFEPSYDYGYSPYTPSYGYEPSYTSSRQPSYEDNQNRGRFGSEERSPREVSGKKHIEKKEEKKDKDKKDKKEEKKDKAIEINSDIERLLAKISNELDEIEEVITSDDRLELIHEYLLENETDNPVDIDLALRAITMLKKKTERAKSNIKAVKNKICNLKDKELEHYTKELNKVIDEHIDLNEFIKNINKVSYKTDSEKRKISNEKRWAYFGDEDVLTTTQVQKQQLQTKVPAPVKITDIKTSINEFTVKIDCAKDKEPKEEKKKPKKEQKKKILKKRTPAVVTQPEQAPIQPITIDDTPSGIESILQKVPTTRE